MLGGAGATSAWVSPGREHRQSLVSVWSCKLWRLWTPPSASSPSRPPTPPPPPAETFAWWRTSPDWCEVKLSRLSRQIRSMLPASAAFWRPPVRVSQPLGGCRVSSVSPDLTALPTPYEGAGGQWVVPGAGGMSQLTVMSCGHSAVPRLTGHWGRGLTSGLVINNQQQHQHNTTNSLPPNIHPRGGLDTSLLTQITI